MDRLRLVTGEPHYGKGRVTVVPSQRIGRVREEVKREVTDILRKMKDPRLGFITVTDAEVSGDLRHVKVYVSVYGDEASKEETMVVLNRAEGHVRSEIGRRVRLRHTPDISFHFDASVERGDRINRLLRELPELHKSEERE